MVTLNANQATHYLTPRGQTLISAAMSHAINPPPLTVIDNICDPAVACGAVMYLEDELPLHITDILNTRAIRAYELLYRNYPLESDAAKAAITQRLAAKTTHTRIAVSFGLFAGLLAGIESTEDSILTPAATMLIREHTPSSTSILFDSFQQYIEQEDEKSYGPVMMFIMHTLHADDLKFSHVFHDRARPVFVQMMRNIDPTEMTELDARFYDWMQQHMSNDDFDAFCVVAVGALQVFYSQMLAAADWPK